MSRDKKDPPDPERSVEPLPYEERRKLFDLPPRTPSTQSRKEGPPPGAGQGPETAHFLELDSARGPAGSPSSAPVVGTIRVGGAMASTLRLAVWGLIAGALLLGAVRWIWRW